MAQQWFDVSKPCQLVPEKYCEITGMKFDRGTTRNWQYILCWRIAIYFLIHVQYACYIKCLGQHMDWIYESQRVMRTEMIMMKKKKTCAVWTYIAILNVPGMTQDTHW